MSTTGLPVVLGKMEWMSNSYGMYVTSSIALGKMEWMSNSYLQCQQGETLNVRLNSFVGRMYENWKKILGLGA